MSLANFHEKAALAASSVLKGFDIDAFAKSLDTFKIAFQFDHSAVASPEGRLTLSLSVNLAARIYPRISITGTGAGSADLSAELQAVARAINPQITLDEQTRGASAYIVVGKTNTRARCPTVYLGSDGWVVKISTVKAMSSGRTNNPFAAGAAACFGAANIFRALFKNQLESAALDAPWEMSLLDFEPNNGHPANPPLSSIAIGEVHLVGLGAIGNGTVWALSKLKDCRGTLVLVDHEHIELSNLQRYVLATQADDQCLKVDMARKTFAGSSLNVQVEPLRWAEYLPRRKNWHLERVLVAVDTAEVRRGIQASLPKWIANAWTQPGDLGLSRHNFLDNGACLMCLYLPPGPQKHFDQLVAEAIGLPTALLEVRRLLFTGEGLTRGFIELISNALKIDVQALLLFEGKPLRVFYSQAVCGGIILSLTKGAVRQNVEVPMAFQSALAGILLAAELVADVGAIRGVHLPTKTTIDLLKPLGTYLSFPHQKHMSGKCVCQDADFVAAYRAKYTA